MTPIPPGPPGTRIWCAVCLNLDNRTTTDATTITAGYCVCDRHAAQLANPRVDFANLIRRLKTRRKGTPT